LGLALTLAVVACAQPKQPEPTPEEKRARELMTAKIAMAPAVVVPGGAAAVDHTKVETQFGIRVSTEMYDRAGTVLEALPKSGPVFAVHTFKFDDGRTGARYQTMFCAAEWPTGGRMRPENEDDAKKFGAWKFDPAKPEELARLAGVDADLVKKQAKTIADFCKNRTLGELLTDERFARLLTGLSLMPKDAEKVTRLNDCFAYERQAWVTLRRKLTGLDKEFPKSFEGPALIKGLAAPEVRAGTEVDARVKPGTAEKIDAALTEWAKDDDQAFAVCVVRNGVIVLHKAYGTRDDKPMTVDTPNWMASITKPMSASLVLMLADRGLLKLDDPVSKFVPALRDVKVTKPLLVWHLHTHTNGLDKFPTGDDAQNDLEYRIADCYPVLKVGSAWAYNGGGYALGGKIIENVTGEAVPLFYKKHLLDPLGCTNTEVSGTHADAYSVPLDIAKFGQMLLNRGAYGKYRFFSEETFEQMLPRKLTVELGPDATKTFGFGLDGQPKKFGHGAASAATFSVDVEQKLVVIMTRNKQGKNQGKYNGKFWDAITAGLEPLK
jgi:CubicO group peptidase (beta-lactamase class C family)